MQTQRIYIGTYTSDGRSAGIYTVEIDTAHGTWGQASVAARLNNPTFLAQGPDARFLYTTSEVVDAASPETGPSAGTASAAGAGRPGSADPSASSSVAPSREPVSGLSALRIQKDATLQLLNGVGVAAKGPATHVTVSPDGHTAFVVHYNAAWVSSLPIQADGTLGKPLEVITHAGVTGPVKDRQDKPHAHSIIPSPDGRYVYVCDLGLDRVYAYAVGANGALREASVQATQPGNGPRHSKVSSDGRFLYVVNELGSSVDVFARNVDTGALRLLQNLSSLPDGFKGANTGAEIQLHPNGRYLYCTNRGVDDLAVFERDPETGLLGKVQNISCGGRHPRHFALSPDGRWLVCANRETDNLVLFAVDPEKGLLRESARLEGVPQPVCVLFPAPLP